MKDGRIGIKIKRDVLRIREEEYKGLKARERNIDRQAEMRDRKRL